MLNEEILRAQRSVKTDAYQMSIGEIVSMYESHEIIIDPEFQRLFRWDSSQKSKLVESLLLGIPLPPIFVFEKADGAWELVDGLQRISTILEFMGKLRGTAGLLPPSVLEATTYLPSLHNVVWEKSEAIEGLAVDLQNELEKGQQLSIRRARIGVEILKRPSDDQTKYDLFQRLNAGGTQANAQELRNCIMLMVNRDFYNEIKEAAGGLDFVNVVSLSEEQFERQRHMEFAVRFLVLTYVDYDGTLDVEDYVDSGVINLAKHSNGKREATIMRNTFSILNEAAGSDALRRYEGDRHQGKVTLVGLEGIAVGVAKNLEEIRSHRDPVAFVREKLRAFWSQPEAANLTSPGLRGTIRIQRTVPFGARWFRP